MRTPTSRELVEYGPLGGTTRGRKCRYGGENADLCRAPPLPSLRTQARYSSNGETSANISVGATLRSFAAQSSTRW
jgi:hypothetical protein